MQLSGVHLGIKTAEPVRRLPTGIGSLDDLLGGGLPRGHLSEIAGGPASGRTAVLYALLASATRRGEVAAVVDLPNALDPPSLARTGADLERVLWVRPPSPQIALKCAELILNAGGFGIVVLDGLGARAARPLPRHVWPRLVQVSRRAGAACLVCAPRRLVGGAAAVALILTPRRVRWSGRVLEGISATAMLARSRFDPSERSVELLLGEGKRAGAAPSAPNLEGGAPSPPVGWGGEATVRRTG